VAAAGEEARLRGCAFCRGRGRGRVGGDAGSAPGVGKVVVRKLGGSGGVGIGDCVVCELEVFNYCII
jgi:hypothetical protein